MCAIVGSFSIDRLIELVSLNSYRGSHSYSYSVFDPISGKLKVISKGLGTLDVNTICFSEGHYGIVHVQAPTTEARSEEFIHPATISGGMLWHNGIVKANMVEELVLETQTTWDTMQILKLISKNNSNSKWDVLSTIDGTFSCLYYDEYESSLYLFRNEISPMFVDKELNISSTKFENSSETPPNQVLKIDFVSRSLHNEYEFDTVENPYYFGD